MAKNTVVECPLCAYQGDDFKPCGLKLPFFQKMKILGGGYRENCVCPSCGSIDRFRLIYMALKYLTEDFAKPIKMLHFAPEPVIARKLRELNSVDYICGDLNPRPGELRMDILNTGCQDGEFDMILCSHVLEHIEDDIAAMKELFRILKPGGAALIAVPVAPDIASTYEDSSVKTPEGRSEHFGQDDHVRVYSWDITDRLNSAGFQTELFPSSDFLSESDCIRLGLNREERIFISHR